MIRATCTIVAILFTVSSAAAEGLSAADRAIELIDEMEEIYRGESARASLTMEIRTPDYERTLSMQSSSIGEENAFIRILSPRKDRGIATLKLGDEMWNYFPKINKVIKVPPSMMMGSWMGSDFTNDDLVQQTKLTEEYDLELEEDDNEYRIILRPREQTVTVWGRIDYRIAKSPLIPLEEVFYDEQGEIIRRLKFTEPREFDGVLLPARLEMYPLNKPGNSTIITYDELEFDPPDIGPDDFTLRNLKSRF